MEKIGLINGKLYRPDTTDMAVTNLLFKKGVITGMGYLPDDDTDTVHVIDCAKKILIPNVVDAGFRLGDQRDLEAALAAGITSVLCLKAGQCLDHPEAIRALLRQTQGLPGPRLFPVGAITKSNAGKELAEMGLMRLEEVVAFTDHCAVSNPDMMKYALQYSAMLNVPLIIRPQWAASSADMNNGWMATKLGLRGEDTLVEEMIVARDIEWVRVYGGTVVFFPITSKGALDRVVDAKKRGISVYCGTAPQYLWFTDAAVEGYNTRYKVFPPLRGSFDVQALIEGVRHGDIDFLASDHTPVVADDKRSDFGSAAFGMSTIDTFLPALMTVLHHRHHVALPTMFALLSVNVDRIFQLKLPPVSLHASPAVTVLDADAKHEVSNPDLQSAVSCNPWVDQPLTGRVDGVFTGAWHPLKG